MWETVHRDVSYSELTGNPFDLEATVTFTHSESGESISTDLFYVGDNSWRFKFTGSRLGEWRYRTLSIVPAFDGLTGTYHVKPNPNPSKHGFLSHRGNHYVVQKGNSGESVAFRFAVYMNEKEFPSYDYWSPFPQDASKSLFFRFEDPTLIERYLDDAQRNGFDTVFLVPGHPRVWVEQGNPRFKTFELLEDFIQRAHDRGMRLHFWMWVDDSRHASPKGFDTSGQVFRFIQKFLFGRLEYLFDGGINGPTDQRLQKYLAARLGPMPGWSMGYGADLHEYVSSEELNKWAQFLHAKMGWDHLLSARGVILNGNNNINSYDGVGRDVMLAHTKHGPVGYQEIVEDLESDTSRPHLYEERHTYKRWGRLDMDWTRRLLWQQQMAGGMGGWYGFFSISHHPYPNPEQLRTHQSFWARNLSLDLIIDNTISDGYVLRTPHYERVIVYKEDGKSLNLDLTQVDSQAKAYMIDTKKEYHERFIGVLKSDKHKLKLPYVSDWVVVVQKDDMK